MNSREIKALGLIGTLIIVVVAVLFESKEIYDGYEKQKTTSLPIQNSLPKDPVVNPPVVASLESVEEEAAAEVNMTEQPVIPQNNQQSTRAPVAQKELPILPLKTPKEKSEIQNGALELVQILKTQGRLTVPREGVLSSQTKLFLDTIAPLIKNASEYYLEIEAYSALSKNGVQAQKLSEKYAQQTANYLSAHMSDNKINDKKISVKGYGAQYPIVEDAKDPRNSRIELKLRRR